MGFESRTMKKASFRDRMVRTVNVGGLLLGEMDQNGVSEAAISS
jgi:hypothetical protein